MNFGYTAADCLFQSTLPHGERPLHWLSAGLCLRFQSTLPHGERLHLDLVDPIVVKISIHAPARGATLSCGLWAILIIISIHAPARGATSKAEAKRYIELFQSTLPHGERPIADKRNSCQIHFNPRSRTGSDRVLASQAHEPYQFQSTLPHGERPVLNYDDAAFK